MKHIIQEANLINIATQLLMADISHYVEDEEAMKNGGNKT